MLVRCTVPAEQYLGVNLFRGDVCQPGFVRRYAAFVKPVLDRGRADRRRAVENSTLDKIVVSGCSGSK